MTQAHILSTQAQQTGRRGRGPLLVIGAVFSLGGAAIMLVVVAACSRRRRGAGWWAPPPSAWPWSRSGC